MAGLMVAAGASASAQDADGAVRLSGAVQLGPNLESFASIAPQSLALSPLERDTLEAAAPVVEPRRMDQTAPSMDQPSASALPWYERFTVAPSESYAVWGAAPREFQLEAGDRWGVTLGYSQGSRSVQNFSLDDFSAGAFFEFSERVRVGGELRFTSPEEEIFGEETENKTPELRFESAFRF